MRRIGYHASHEQFSPAELLASVREAGQAGFTAAMSSDHIAPWTESGHSGFAWSWLGAALEATSLPFGVVTCPIGFRYHPAILAHAAATLSQMYEGRFWMALGSGEAMNEHVVGAPWPPKAERNARLRSAADIMRALFRGQTVSTDEPIRTHAARLYSLPEQTPLLFGAALTPETAHFCGEWADGLITVNRPHDELRELVRAFREGGGIGKPLYLQAHVAWAENDDAARRLAQQEWRNNSVPSNIAADLVFPSDFDRYTRENEPSDLELRVRVSADLGQQRSWLEEDFELGFDAVFLHQVGRNQLEFIRTFGEGVLPCLAR